MRSGIAKTMRPRLDPDQLTVGRLIVGSPSTLDEHQRDLGLLVGKLIDQPVESLLRVHQLRVPALAGAIRLRTPAPTAATC